MEALLAFAINAGGLGAAKPQYVNPLVADAPDTIFTIATDDVAKTVTAQALGMDDPNNPDPTNPDAASIKALKTLYDTLVPFGDQVGRGNATDAGLYEPTAYRATLQEGQAQGEMIDWPWTDVTPRRLRRQPGLELPRGDAHRRAGQGARRRSPRAACSPWRSRVPTVRRTRSHCDPCCPRSRADRRQAYSSAKRSESA